MRSYYRMKIENKKRNVDIEMQIPDLHGQMRQPFEIMKDCCRITGMDIWKAPDHLRNNVPELFGLYLVYIA